MADGRDEREGRTRTVARVGINLRGDRLVPDEVSHLMGMTPTRAHAKGDLSPRMRTPRPWGMWGLEVEDEDVEPAARRLLDMLKGKREVLSATAARFSATIAVTVWWEPEGGQGGYSITAALLGELAGLAEDVHFYFP